MTTSGASLLGAAVHGLAPWPSEGGTRLPWRATLVLIGLTSFLLLAGAATAELRGAARAALLGLAAANLLAHLGRLRSRDDFAVAAVDPGVALLGVLGLELYAVGAGSPAGAGWIIAGALLALAGGAVLIPARRNMSMSLALLALAGGAVQRTGWTLHRHFNHNDLFHVVQMAAAYLIFRGGLLL